MRASATPDCHARPRTIESKTVRVSRSTATEAARESRLLACTLVSVGLRRFYIFVEAVPHEIS